ncbi:50S ribosomal protein L19 [candidate division WWE3 bacterium]|uniref:Large ribosomal subunit protein bL19 n=1 Tax=candidate division WWE3 bacterium TaxID=2053526 RepID=A0A7X9E7S9_UNCKA|nr:50S ribosomal protein L19 [candidate division WWE3 bacterium]
MTEEKKNIKKEEIEKPSQSIEKVEKEKADLGENKQENTSSVNDAGEVKEELKSAVEEDVELKSIKSDEKKIQDFRVGDTVKVSYKIIEGGKTRIQPYQGIVIAVKGSGVSKTFTVRKISVDRIGVERIFPICSPNIEGVKVVKKGKVRRSKLYYLRERVGKKATRIKERY